MNREIKFRAWDSVYNRMIYLKDCVSFGHIDEFDVYELYFEEKDLKTFAEKLERLYPSIQYVNKLMTHSCGHQVVRFYDLDGHLIEVRTPM